MMEIHNRKRFSPRGVWACAARGRLLQRCAILCVGIGIQILNVSVARAQHMDSFEGGEPRWRLVESDCGAELGEQAISQIMPHNGRTAELLELACTAGKYAFLAYPIEPCAAISEFQPELWVRCASSRVQLGVRIIFPRARHPITQGRLTAILWGDSYDQPGQWQLLRIQGMEKLLSVESIAVRQELGSELDLDGAYVDSLVVNAYTGPGRYRLQIDDLNLRGMIPLASIGIPLSPKWRENWQWRAPVASAEQRFWAAANRPPVWLQHRGEDYAWVQSMGFSGLLMSKLPSEEQLERIQRASLSVIAPPPMNSLQFAEKNAESIRGWFVGGALHQAQADLARAQVQLVSNLAPELRRPLVGEALEQFWLFGRIADEVIVPAPASYSAGTLQAKQRWLAESLQLTKRRGSGWVSLNVDEGSMVVDQLSTARVAIDATAEPMQSMPSDPLVLHHEVAEAVAAGARGFLFRTSQALRYGGLTDSTQVAALRWINTDLTIWGPWIIAGQQVDAPLLSRADFAAAAWKIDQSQLVIAHSIDPHGQYCVPPTQSTPLTIELPQLSAAQQVLRLTVGGMERLQLETTNRGLSCTIERPNAVESLVITSNPSVLSFLRRKTQESAMQNVADLIEIANYNLLNAREVIEARFPIDAGGSDRGLRREQLERFAAAQRQLDDSMRAMRSNLAIEAGEAALLAVETIQSLLYEAHRVAVSNLATPQSSPFVVSPALLSYHWKLADACERSQWRDLPIEGSELNNLSHMLEAGWTAERRLEDRVELRVELVPPTHERSAGLRMAAYQREVAEDAAASPVPGGYEGASLRVRTGAAGVSKGQLVRVAAKARVLRSVMEPASGLLVYDNQAGPGLGQLVQGVVGELIDVELYRFAVSDGEFRILAECRGECDIVLENVRVSVIEPATDRRSYGTTPTGFGPATIIGEAYVPQDSAPVSLQSEF